MQSVTGWYASVDYVRLTAPHSERHIYKRWRKLARLAAIETDDYAEETEHTRRMQYYGCSFGSAFVGASDNQGIMLQASGATAQAICLRYGDMAYSVPRLDLQVTVWFDGDAPDRAEKASELHMARRKPNERQPLPTLYKSFGKGDTFYAGSRGGTGSNYVRLYDKGRESGIDVYRNSWRYEVELTNRRAIPAFDALRRYSFDANDIAAQVKYHCSERYIDLPSLEGVAPIDAGLIPKPATTDASRLRWLSNQVAPALEKLIERGYNRDYLERILFQNACRDRIEGDIDNEC